ncbi:MAG: hypothetical protein N2712_05135 [Brevinematales bacterium]|nr:hypothetical protein [Brevinematales bacterium]
MKRLILFAAVILASSSAFACFDTYLFFKKYSMVYPKGKFVTDALLEYSANTITSPENDTFFANLNFFYGISEKLSIQLGIGSKEITRNEVFEIEEIGIRGVFNIISEPLFKSSDNFTLDIILEHHQGIFGTDMSFEFSLPGIIYIGNLIGVIHPVFSLEDIVNESIEYTMGGHIGLFYLINNTALVGIGAEYRSSQNGSTFGSRIIEGEIGVSLFLGAKLGDNMYLQNEFAKGLANSRDFGLAVTLKIIP